MNSAAIVTLTCHPEIFRQFRKSCVDLSVRAQTIAVTSGEMSKIVAMFHLDSFEMDGVKLLAGVEPFIFARNANAGIAAAGRSDVLLMNDDVEFLRLNSVERLRDLAYSGEEIGVLSPRFVGLAGGPLQQAGYGHFEGLKYSTDRLAFVAVYLKRSVLDALEYEPHKWLDERFDGYGRDDDDFCRRARGIGLKLAVTDEVIFKHGFGEAKHSASYRRRQDFPANGIDPRMTQVYKEKWGDAK